MPVQLCRQRESDGFRVLYDIEAYLRILVRWELRGIAGREWRGLLDSAAVRNADSRRRQEQDDGLIDSLASGLLSYLHLSELKDVVLGPLWSRCFAPNWAAQDVVKSEFKKLIAVRNKVAHFRPITEWDAKVVTRFAEDLARWTRPYRRLREVELRWDLWAPLEGDFAGRAKKLGIDGALQALKSRVLTPGGDDTQIAFVGHHVACRIKKSGGAYSPQAVQALLESAESDVTLARVGDFGASIEVLVPIKVGLAGVAIVLERVIELCRHAPVAAVSSDELIGAYGLDLREGVLSAGASFPDPFAA
jgi:hypothetical protein